MKIYMKCVAIPTAAKSVYKVLTADGNANPFIDLQIMNIGATDGCGIKKIELIELEQSEEFVVHPATSAHDRCPGDLCKFVEFKKDLKGQYKFRVKVTLINEEIVYAFYSGGLNTVDGVGTFSIPDNAFPTKDVFKGAVYDYEFLPFSYIGDELYGWKEPYKVTQIAPSCSSRNPCPKYTYPPTGVNLETDCKSFKKCTKIKITTNFIGQIKLKIETTSLPGKKLSGEAIINVVCGSESTVLSIADFRKYSNGNWRSPLPLYGAGSDSPNYVVQTVAQNKATPDKSFNLH